MTWSNSYHGPAIGIGSTFDFENFTFLENAFLSYNRNNVLFPRKIDGKSVMLNRLSDHGHSPFGDIYLSHGSDMTHLPDASQFTTAEPNMMMALTLTQFDDVLDFQKTNLE